MRTCPCAVPELVPLSTHPRPSSSLMKASLLGPLLPLPLPARRTLLPSISPVLKGISGLLPLPPSLRLSTLHCDCDCISAAAFRVLGTWVITLTLFRRNFHLVYLGSKSSNLICTKRVKKGCVCARQNKCFPLRLLRIETDDLSSSSDTEKVT